MATLGDAITQASVDVNGNNEPARTIVVGR
jgi:hypothetical protein